MPRTFIAGALLYFLSLLLPASADYPGWQGSGSIFILTTPEGANLPATASLENVPLLLRLSRESFDFSQAQAHGEDLRVATAQGEPLAYQIEEWDAARGVAAIFGALGN